MPYFYYDYYYIVLVVPVIILSLIVQAKLKSTYSKYSKLNNMRGITGAQAAQLVLEHYGITDVAVLSGKGTLTDHFDPVQKRIVLSDGVYNNTSIAAVGIACHEAGHAAQHAQGYAPIRIRNSILPVCNIGSAISMPLLLIGLFISFYPLVWFGIAFFSLTAIFQLVTLPVEFNASHRAVAAISQLNILDDGEIKGVKKVLSAAAMTYVASFIQNLLILIYYVVRTKRRR